MKNSVNLVESKKGIIEKVLTFFMYLIPISLALTLGVIIFGSLATGFSFLF